VWQKSRADKFRQRREREIAESRGKEPLGRIRDPSGTRMPGRLEVSNDPTWIDWILVGSSLDTDLA